MESYNIYDINKETVSLFKECFDNNGSPKKSENIEWQFLRNPTSSAFVDILFDKSKNKTAGIYAITCVNFKIDNSTVLGSQSLDTLTDIDYRGLGLFTKMAKDVYAKAEAKGVGLVYGFPNGSSFPGFRKLLKWDQLDPLPFLIKPLRSRYFTKRIKYLNFLPNFNLSIRGSKKYKELQIRIAHSFPVNVNDIWDKFAKNIRVSVVRDLSYLNWRYIDKPNEKYQIMHCYSIDNDYLGCVVFTVKEKHEGKIGYIMELLFDPEKPRVGEFLLSCAVEKIKQEKADCILSWCLEHSPNYSTFKKKFFLKMPERLRPIELHFAVRGFDSKISSIISDRSNWYISYSDSDTV